MSESSCGCSDAKRHSVRTDLGCAAVKLLERDLNQAEYGWLNEFVDGGDTSVPPVRKEHRALIDYIEHLERVVTDERDARRCLIQVVEDFISERHALQQDRNERMNSATDASERQAMQDVWRLDGEMKSRKDLANLMRRFKAD